MVGKSVLVWWADDTMWYHGTIDSYDGYMHGSKSPPPLCSIPTPVPASQLLAELCSIIQHFCTAFREPRNAAI
jgi:hypothetical protein